MILGTGGAAKAVSAYFLTGVGEKGKVIIVGRSVHGKDFAEYIKADYIFLSPIKETLTKKKLQPLGWEKFSELSKKTQIPVYALGGLSEEDLSEAEKYGGYGVAGISRFW